MKLKTKRLKVLSKTTTYTATTEDDVILVNDAAGSFTLTLPPAAQWIGKVITVKKTNASSNRVTIDGNAAETLDGKLTRGLAGQYQGYDLMSDGTNISVKKHGPLLMTVSASCGNGGAAATTGSMVDANTLNATINTRGGKLWVGLVPDGVSDSTPAGWNVQNVGGAASNIAIGQMRFIKDTTTSVIGAHSAKGGIGVTSTALSYVEVPIGALFCVTDVTAGSYTFKAQHACAANQISIFNYARLMIRELE